MNDYLALVLGVVCAGIGGEVFVRGVVGVGHWTRISPGIVAATLAAFATSTPELSVAVNAASEGTPEIALGNALGANVVNIGLILALVLCITGLHPRRDGLGMSRDFAIALIVPPAIGVLSFDGLLSRLDALALLLIFSVWLALTVFAVRKSGREEAAIAGVRPLPVMALCALGLALLFAAGQFIVQGAEGIATALRIDPFIIGATIVAIGTTIPELATAVVAALRKHDEVGLGAILGSNIFNALFVVPVAALIHPITVHWHDASIALAFGVATVALCFPPRGGFLGRGRGAMLLALYGGYLFAITRVPAGPA